VPPKIEAKARSLARSASVDERREPLAVGDGERVVVAELVEATTVGCPGGSLAAVTTPARLCRST
jgi:hypothetical protein